MQSLIFFQCRAWLRTCTYRLSTVNLSCTDLKVFESGLPSPAIHSEYPSYGDPVLMKTGGYVIEGNWGRVGKMTFV